MADTTTKEKTKPSSSSSTTPQSYKQIMGLVMAKRDRRPNFSQSELNAFVDALEQRLDLVNGKRLSSGIIERMNGFAMMRAWGEVAERVNAVSDVLRTGQEMRDKWCDLKSRVKRKEIVLRNKAAAAQRRRQDGDDVVCLSPPAPGLSSIEERVSRIIRKINHGRIPAVRHHHIPRTSPRQQQRRQSEAKPPLLPVITKAISIIPQVTISSPTLPDEPCVDVRSHVPAPKTVVVEQATTVRPVVVQSLPDEIDLTTTRGSESSDHHFLQGHLLFGEDQHAYCGSGITRTSGEDLATTNGLLATLVEKHDRMASALGDLVRETTRRRLIEEETLEALQMLVSVQNRRLQLDEHRALGHASSSSPGGGDDGGGLVP